jgi:hypothetical protein
MSIKDDGKIILTNVAVHVYCVHMQGFRIQKSSSVLYNTLYSSFIFLDFPRIRGKLTYKMAPFSALSVSNRQKKLPQIWPAAPLFIQPLFSYVAEKSASWQHWVRYFCLFQLRCVHPLHQGAL